MHSLRFKGLEKPSESGESYTGADDVLGMWSLGTMYCGCVGAVERDGIAKWVCIVVLLLDCDHHCGI